jgi:hypothetical protein
MSEKKLHFNFFGADEEYNDLVFMAWCLEMIEFWVYDYVLIKKENSRVTTECAVRNFFEVIGEDRFDDLERTYFSGGSEQRQMIHEHHMDFRFNLHSRYPENPHDTERLRYKKKIKTRFICDMIEYGKYIDPIFKYILSDETEEGSDSL